MNGIPTIDSSLSSSSSSSSSPSSSSSSSLVTSSMRMRCCRFFLLLLALLFLINDVSTERDFNINDSQVPLLEAKDEPHHLANPYLKELSQCEHTDSDIILSLVLKKHDWQDISVAKRNKLQDKMSKFFAIPKEYIIMDSVTKHEMLAMQKESMRRGNNKCHVNSKHLGRVSFKIGCGPAYFSIGQPIAKQIGHQMKDGSIDNITEEKFGWWIIWRRQMKSRSHRARRQVEGSGQSDYEDYDYEGEEEEQSVTEVPVTAAAPIESSHGHRHHHGDSDKSEENDVLGNPETEDNRESNSGQVEASSTTTARQEEVSSTSPATPVLTTIATPATPASVPDTTPASSYPSTDYVEPKVENTPPLIKTRLQKFAVTSGKSFHFIIPEDTFIDAEDATNLRLELTDKDGHELKPSSWLQYNSDKREIYGLPLDEAASKWKFLLTATDSGNESVTETLDISVQQHRGLRAVNHEINIDVKINVKGLNNIDWQLKLMDAIAETLGDDSVSSIVVREVRQTIQDPHKATFVYFNETLPLEQCPETELNHLVKRLDASRLSDLVHPTLGIKSITGSLIGSCQKIHEPKPKAPTHLAKLKPPIPRNQVDRVNATLYHLLVYKVPSDTFFDPNGDELVLSLKSKDNKDLNPKHWLQFDSKNQEFYGVPRTIDKGSEEYLLVAENSAGLTATDALVVVVNHPPKREFSVYYKALLNVKHEHFTADLQRKFIERLSLLHGDRSDRSFIQLKAIVTDHDTGGVIVSFYNTSLYRTHSRCPDKEADQVRNVYLTKDNALRERVKKALGPELNISKFEEVQLGSCHIHVETPHREFIPSKPDEPLLKSTFSEEYMTTYILPIIIIITMVLVAVLIACCLHRRRAKSGKMELGDDEERKSFRPKAPVIFQDELDEKPEMGNKSPIILKNEKPPLLPPSYNTSNMNGDTDVDKYEPPSPVILNGREARGKSPATPSYRKPPPYVSP